MVQSRFREVKVRDKKIQHLELTQSKKLYSNSFKLNKQILRKKVALLLELFLFNKLLLKAFLYPT